MCCTSKFYKKGGHGGKQGLVGQLWMAELTSMHIMTSVRCEIPLRIVQKLKAIVHP